MRHAISSPARPQVQLAQLQLTMRLLFGVLAGVYLAWLPEPALVFPPWLVVGGFVAYFAFFALWWGHARGRASFSERAVRVGMWVELSAAWTLVLNDPRPFPPTLLLVMTSVLASPLQHGTRVFLENALGALVLGLVVLPLRQVFAGGWPAHELLCGLLFMVLATYYGCSLATYAQAVSRRAQTLGELDPLTGLLNRRGLEQAAHALLQTSGGGTPRLAMLFADLDDFKAVNDSRGHQAGDEVLCQFAALARGTLRGRDVGGRYGGDEFVFILTDTDRAGAEAAASRLGAEFSEWAAREGLAVGVSFGIITVPAGPVTLASLLEEVDASLYEAKRARKRRVAMEKAG